MAATLADLLEQVVEALGAGELIAPLLLERVEVRSPPSAFSPDAVEILDHLAHALEIRGRHVPSALFILHERLHRCARSEASRSWNFCSAVASEKS